MRRLLFLTAVSSGIFLLVWTTIFEMVEEKEIVSEDREDLKEIAYANNDCSRYWRGELVEMVNNKTHDYANDPIFLECKNFED